MNNRNIKHKKIMETALRSTTKISAFFKGSKVPVSFIVDYLKAGYTKIDFLSSYPWLNKRELTRKWSVLENAYKSTVYAA